MEHTPGKWVADRLNHVWREYRDDLGRLCNRPQAEIVGVATHESEQSPNARLIAAAPEMLKTLVKAAIPLEAIQASVHWELAKELKHAVADAVSAIRKVIAKAGGDI